MYKYLPLKLPPTYVPFELWKFGSLQFEELLVTFLFRDKNLSVNK